MSFDIEQFKNPPKKYRPFIRWWWPGLAVQKDELERELKELDAQGFGGVEIQPFLIGGSGGSPAKETHRYAPNPYFYEILEFVLQKTSELGMITDLTFGSSWPPGGTVIDKEHSLKTLMMGTKIIKGPKHIETHIPRFQLNAYYKHMGLFEGIVGNVQDDFTKYINDFKPIATIAIKPIKKSRSLNFIFPRRTPLDYKTSINVTSFVSEEGILSWDVPKGHWQIFTVYGGPTGMTPMSPAKSVPKSTALTVDILDSDSIKLLLESVLGINAENFEKLKQYFGNTLRALFTDSQEIASEWFWTPKFFEEFQKKRGYDIRPYLPVCFVPNRDNQFFEVFFQNEKPCYEFREDEIGKKIRYDWLKTLGEIWSDKYIKYISDWGKNYGIKHRIQTYGMPVDLLTAYAASDIPETETLFSGAIDFFKVAGSAGILYNKPIISSETFSWAKRDLMMTPFKWKVICDRLFVSGINQQVFHGWSYQTEKIEQTQQTQQTEQIELTIKTHPTNKNNPKVLKSYPGRYPWKTHGFSENLNHFSPIWEYYPKLNQYVTRAQYLLSQGKTICNIGMYNAFFNYDYKHLSRKEEMIEGHLHGFDAPKGNDIVLNFMRFPRSKFDKRTLSQQNLGRQLMEHGFYYTHVNEESILSGELVNGKLKIGSAELETILFPNIEKISLPLAEKIEELCKNGIHVVFYRFLPDGQPGFLNYKINDIKIKKIIYKLHGNGLHYIDKKTNIGGYVLNIIGIKPGIQFSTVPSPIEYIHKEIPAGDLYFIRSTKENSFRTIVAFKHYDITPYVLDLWDGNIRPIIKFKQIKKENESIFQLEFPPYGSQVILFPKTPIQKEIIHIDGIGTELKLMNGNPVSFTKSTSLRPIKLDSWHLTVWERKIDGELEPIEISLSKLIDWRKNKKIQFCSGPGHYSTIFFLNEDYIHDETRLILNLGKVHDVAVITLNGHEFSPILIPSYEIDITKYVEFGENTLKISITGALINRMAGYGKNENGNWKIYKKRQTMPIGLLGPVVIIPELVIKYKSDE